MNGRLALAVVAGLGLAYGIANYGLEYLRLSGWRMGIRKTVPFGTSISHGTSVIQQQ